MFNYESIVIIPPVAPETCRVCAKMQWSSSRDLALLVFFPLNCHTFVYVTDYIMHNNLTTSLKSDCTIKLTNNWVL